MPESMQLIAVVLCLAYFGFLSVDKLPEAITAIVIALLIVAIPLQGSLV